MTVVVLFAACHLLAACGAGGLGSPLRADIARPLDCRPTCAIPASGGLGGPQILTIRNDHGGAVVDYAVQAIKLRENGAKLRFAGRCDSACTMYLSLPRSQTCITPYASFGFHAPSAATSKASYLAQEYLLKTYPDWVKSWIASKGGLSKEITTMNYAYASQFMDRCDQKLV
ncbi:MAG: hypothetical protein ACREDX_05980 [Aestuariivirga sp.]